ncbi:hypothetical protein CFN79_02290 [Chromobacterium vaccinii]|nr:hypothetical protein CFN79_02290 [Chromobacterium vaccinii]
MTTHIDIRAYNPTWPQCFQTERLQILAALGPLADASAIEHIGSTAVPGLAAKPIIDIMLGLPALNDIEPYIPALKSAGFHLQPQMAAAMPDRHDFAKPAAHPRSPSARGGAGQRLLARQTGLPRRAARQPSVGRTLCRSEAATRAKPRR